MLIYGGMGVRNGDIADLLERVGDLLEVQHANPHRVRAYRSAARTCRTWTTELARVVAERGREGLLEIPTIGRTLAAQIDEIVHSGRLAMLDRLEGQLTPEELFTTIPGIGDELAHRIHDELDVETLEDLELAAHDGRLAGVHGFGPRRSLAVREALGSMLSRSSRRHARMRRFAEAKRPTPGAEPSTGVGARPEVATLLAVDAEYRRRAERGELPRVAPRRFNPGGDRWLPIWHCERSGWSFSALFSNTARAHALGRTRDWVVLYYERDGEEDQSTVVTERVGPLRGRRVVRGRERESAACYGESDSAPGRKPDRETSLSGDSPAAFGAWGS